MVPFFWTLNSPQLHQFDDPVINLFPGFLWMVYKDGFCNLLADFYSRVQGGHRILKNHGKGTAADFLHFLFFIICNVSSVKKDLPDFIWALPGKSFMMLLPQYTFSAAGFAYNGQHFSFFQGKRDVPHSLYFSSCTVKADGQDFSLPKHFFLAVSLFCNRPVFHIPENTNSMVPHNGMGINSLNAGIRNVIGINVADKSVCGILCKLF